ncbi:hypothetical protein D3C87_1624010 [compost metagenome]
MIPRQAVAVCPRFYPAQQRCDSFGLGLQFTGALGCGAGFRQFPRGEQGVREGTPSRSVLRMLASERLGLHHVGRCPGRGGACCLGRLLLCGRVHCGVRLGMRAAGSVWVMSARGLGGKRTKVAAFRGSVRHRWQALVARRGSGPRGAVSGGQGNKNPREGEFALRG